MSTGNHPIEIKFDEFQTNLITGSNGAGKCLRGNTIAKVVFSQRKFKDLYGEDVVKMSLKEIKELFERHPELLVDGLYVITRFGYKRVEYADVTKKDSHWISLRIDESKLIECSEEHLLFKENHGWIAASELKVNDYILTNDKYQRIKYIERSIFKEDLYDLQVAEVKEFYANNIVSHNSTMIESLIFGLYGKPFRKINKGQLLNSVNKKDLLVEIWFSVGSDKYKVVRGIKPNIFEIYKNEELVDQSAASRDYQAELENDILKMNLKAFTQIVVLGMATFVPFMELPAAQRREFIEELLDYSIFSKMNTLFKDDLSDNKLALKDVSKDIETEKSLIETIKRHNQEILRLKNQNKDHLKEEILTLLDETDEKKNLLKSNRDAIENLRETISDEDSVISKIEARKEIIRDLSKDIASHKKDASFYETNETCPTCDQLIPEKLRKEKIFIETSSKEEKEKAIIKLNSMVEKLEKRKSEIDDIHKEISKLEKYSHQLNAEIKNNTSIMLSNKKKLEETSVEEIKNDKLIISQERLRKLHDVFNEETKNKEIYAIISSILKDTGLKSHMVKKYVDVINVSINSYLEAFGLYVDFHLDENFNEVIKSRYRDEFSFSSFSEGEKMRINFAILFAWRELAKLRNSMTTNLLILDEVLDGVVDSEGLVSIISSLKSMNKNDNIFVITHRGNQVGDGFERNLHFAKDGNFSILKEE